MKQKLYKAQAARLVGLWLVLLLVACACGSSRDSTSSESSRLLPDPYAKSTTGPADTGSSVQPTRVPETVDDYLSLQEYYARRRAQQSQFEHITEDDGLSSETVYWITQDRFGFLWIATNRGLNRWDGSNFVVYRHDPDDPRSLSDDHIFNVQEDHLGNIWVATYGGGLERFDRDSGIFIHYAFDPKDPDSISHNKIFTIFEDRYGVLWVGTSGGGLDQYDRTSDRFIHYRHDPDNALSLAGDYVNAIYEDRDGVLWIGTTSGLDRFERQSGSFVHYRHDPQDPGSLSSDLVFSIVEDQMGDLWVGTSGGGLNRLDRETGVFSKYRHDPANPNSLSDDVAFVLLEDSVGTLWVGSMGGGLNQYDRQKDQFIRYQYIPGDPRSLSNDYVNALFEDREGTLWIGTTRNLDKYSRQREKFTQLLRYEHVQVIYEDRQESVWVGTLDGLYQLDRNLQEVAFYTNDPEDPASLARGWVQALCEDQTGALWIGLSAGGLDRFERATGRFIHYRHKPEDPTSLSNDVVNSIYQDRSGTLWIGTDGGLNRFDRERNQFRVVPTEAESPGSSQVEGIGPILQDQQGTLWVGVWGDGLKGLNPDTGKFVAFRHEPGNSQSLKTNFVTAIVEDSAGRLWIGTDGGLHLYERSKNGFRLFDTKSGLQSESVSAILEDHDGKLWIGAGAGLSVYDPNAETFANYDSGDGLKAGGYVDGTVMRRSGQMLLGGADGIDVFRPEQIQPNPWVPPVVLVSLRQDGQDVVLEQALETVESLSFSWPQNEFEFEFVALSFTQPDKNQYAYKLEGYDQDWIYSGTDGVGRYSGLSGGTYTLLLRGTNDDSVWNQKGTSVRITIVPPIWETWWFLAAVALVVVGSVLVGYRWRVRSIEARSQQLSNLIRERTAELSKANELLSQEIVERKRVQEALAQRAAEAAVVEERSRLARDLHDAVTQTLFSASLIAEALPALWENDPDEGRELLGDLRQLNRGALAEMRTLLMELRPTALVEANLGDLLRQLAEAAAGRTGVPVQVTIEGICVLPSEVHVALYRIAQEALNNVVKHASAHTASVSLHCVAAPWSGVRSSASIPRGISAELKVVDDGRGFDLNSTAQDRLGLCIFRERAQAIGAVLSLDSKPGHGTTVSVLWRDPTAVQWEQATPQADEA